MPRFISSPLLGTGGCLIILAGTTLLYSNKPSHGPAVMSLSCCG
ncbi:MAG: hypothetical protein RSD82_05990 [Comamonas sp.]